MLMICEKKFKWKKWEHVNICMKISILQSEFFKCNPEHEKHTIYDTFYFHISNSHKRFRKCPPARKSVFFSEVLNLVHSVVWQTPYVASHMKTVDSSFNSCPYSVPVHLEMHQKFVLDVLPTNETQNNASTTKSQWTRSNTMATSNNYINALHHTQNEMREEWDTHHTCVFWSSVTPPVDEHSLFYFLWAWCALNIKIAFLKTHSVSFR